MEKRKHAKLFSHPPDIYIHCKYVHLIFSALKKKWQGKGELLSKLEMQVKQMKESFDIKEKKLIEERNKSLQTQR